MHIGPYKQAGHFGHDEKRRRKLLAHKREIERLMGRVAMRGYALVPVKVYFKNGRAKVELALGKGRKVHDQRESIRRDLDLKEARDAMSRNKR
jgi:SsrA-binding protein